MSEIAPDRLPFESSRTRANGCRPMTGGNSMLTTVRLGCAPQSARRLPSWLSGGSLATVPPIPTLAKGALDVDPLPHRM